MQGTYPFHRTLGGLLKELRLERKVLFVIEASADKNDTFICVFGKITLFLSLPVSLAVGTPFLRAVCTRSFLAVILIHSCTGNEERGGYCLLGLLWSNPEVPEVRRLVPQPKFIQGFLMQASTTHSPLWVVVSPLYWVFHVNTTLKGVMRETVWTPMEYLLYVKQLTFMISLNTHVWSHFPHKETGSEEDVNSPEVTEPVKIQYVFSPSHWGRGMLR